jgi:hypothetical protein
MKKFLKSIIPNLVLSLVISIVFTICIIYKSELRSWYVERNKRLDRENNESLYNDRCGKKCDPIKKDCSSYIDICNAIAEEEIIKGNHEVWKEYKIKSCLADDLTSCLDLSRKLIQTKDKENAKKHLTHACRDGSGGNIEACGELSYLIESKQPAKAKVYRKYACNIGFARFCEK